MSVLPIGCIALNESMCVAKPNTYNHPLGASGKLKKQTMTSDSSVQFDRPKTENKMSRHSSLRKSLNFYPTAFFAEGVLAITHCTHCQATRAITDTKACQKVQSYQPAYFVDSFNRCFYNIDLTAHIKNANELKI